jgi:hypothetical protein
LSAKVLFFCQIRKFLTIKVTLKQGKATSDV